MLLSLVREIEIVGEAAGKVSDECKAAATGIPWTMVVGIGNRLIYRYFDLDLEVVWSTLTSDLPG